MKIAKKHMNRMAQYSRNSNTHNKKGVHGKWLENFCPIIMIFLNMINTKQKLTFPKKLLSKEMFLPNGLPIGKSNTTI